MFNQHTTFTFFHFCIKCEGWLLADIVHSVKKLPRIDHSKSPLKEIVKNRFDAKLALLSSILTWSSSAICHLVCWQCSMLSVYLKWFSRFFQWIRISNKEFVSNLNLLQKLNRVKAKNSTNIINHCIHLIWLWPTFFSFQNSNYHFEALVFSRYKIWKTIRGENWSLFRKMRLKNVLMFGLFVGISVLFREGPTLKATK